MRWLKRIGLSLAGLIAVAAVALLLWEPLLPPLPAPPADAKPARAFDVSIARDEWGVPHVRGKTDPDVAYGLAYAHAEDDFATLQEVLAGVRGRSGAFLGQDGAKMDFATHLLGIWATTNRDYERVLAPDLRALLEAYAAGLNRYAEKHPGEVRLRGLFPVTGRDVAAGFVLRSPFFYGLDRPLGALVEGKPVPRDAGPADERGSNAFAIAGVRSSDGVTRLVSNSHQPWAGPVAWYEAVVHSDDGWDFAGALFPGAPFPLLGHNKTLGWTNTVNRPDLIDVYRLTLDGSGDNYRFDGGWRPLERTRVWLRVKFGPFVLPVPRTILRSVHGPVIVNDTGAYALRYAGIDDIRAVDSYYRLNKAKDFAEWQAIMARQAIVGTNFVYADAAGRIAFIYNARFPKRAPGYDWKGVLPGDTSRTLWSAYEPYSAYPQVIDPKSGWVANANNTPFIATAPADQLKPEAYAKELGIETFVTNRARRYDALFAEIEGKPISREDLMRIKFDKGYAQAGPAKRWIDAVLAVDPAGDSRLAEAQALLRTWDWAQDGKGGADALA
ncbi:MAG: penicillin acylase family protein, partial [Alphaproteobacteria bacterium]|nr:penicillin acylase family protein [Alphaproteobacteria bacterium]